MSNDLALSIKLSVNRYGDRPALCAPGRASVNYRDLWRAIDARQRALGMAGIGRASRIAILLPAGIDEALELVAVLVVATAVPLSPRTGAEALRRQLQSCRVDAVVHLADAPAEVLAVIEELGLLSIAALPAGESSDTPWRFCFPVRRHERAPVACDAALILQTSGTTGVPKRVPLTQSNLAAAAASIARSLAMGPSDRALNMLPLGHVHGLVGSVLATLTSGGSVVCTPGFEHASFSRWLREFEPSWYTATPTIHIAALRAMDDEDARPPASIRFIRSASAPLAPVLIERLERRFGVPVIEAYGATEASSPISSNPLPPGKRKIGSVGTAVGVEIRIVDATGHHVARGITGEILVRGPNVMAGYESDSQCAPTGPDDNAFIDGWFRTGDLGSLDDDGHLSIRGRIKEQINRGGEKVSPREVDDALLSIDGVREAAAFGVAHPTLGEDVAAAVVLAHGSTLTVAGLRPALEARLDRVKMPTTFHVVDSLPRNANGKIQRYLLSSRFDSSDRERLEPVVPQDALTDAVADLWRKVLAVPASSSDADFFACGGDSLQAARIVAQLNATWGIDLPASAVFEHRTIAALVRCIHKTRTVDPINDFESMSDADPALVADIDAMTDEEVAHALKELSAAQAT